MKIKTTQLYNDVMIDIETLDTTPSAIILSIGARAFNLATGEKDPKGLHVTISIQEQIDEGRTHSIAAAMWWGGQPQGIQQESFSEEESFLGAIKALEEYFYDYCYSDCCVWSKSPAFDLVILKHALRSLLRNEIWNYRRERDVRTYLWALPSEKFEEAKESKHVAIADVDIQIEEVCRAYQLLNEKESNTRTDQLLDTQG